MMIISVVTWLRRLVAVFSPPMLGNNSVPVRMRTAMGIVEPGQSLLFSTSAFPYPCRISPILHTCGFIEKWRYIILSTGSFCKWYIKDDDDDDFSTGDFMDRKLYTSYTLSNDSERPTKGQPSSNGFMRLATERKSANTKLNNYAIVLKGRRRKTPYRGHDG